MNENPLMEPKEKAALLRAGIEREGNPSETIERLCLAVALLTSRDKATRETAKRRIREYVEIGRQKTGG